MELAKSILDKYFATKKIKSSTSHSNSHGIVVTVRFSHDDLQHHGDSSVPVSDSEPQGTVSFKRISDKQVKRNQKRFGNFKNKVVDNKYETRSKSKSKSNSREDIRCDDSSDSTMHGHLIYPEPLRHSVCDVDPALLIHSTESPCSEQAAASDVNLTSPGVVLQEESIPQITMPHSPHESTDSDHSSDTCDDRSGIYSGSCSEAECSYGGYVRGKDHDKVHRPRSSFRFCRRKDPDAYGGVCGLCICAKCLNNGKHKRHKHYLKPPDDNSFMAECLHNIGLDKHCQACNNV